MRKRSRGPAPISAKRLKRRVGGSSVSSLPQSSAAQAHANLSSAPAVTETVVELEAIALDSHGAGVTAEGVSVPGVLPGERALAQISGRRAKAREILTTSTERAEPFCPWYGRCGGCATQHMDGNLYRAWKRGLIVEALTHAGVDTKVGP